MKKITIEDLYQRLQIPDDVIAKFSNIKQKKHIDFLINLFYKDEDRFFEYLETNLKEAYLDVLYIYLNLAVILYQKYLDNRPDSQGGN